MECNRIAAGTHGTQPSLGGIRQVLESSLAGGCHAVWLIDPTRYETVSQCAAAFGITDEKFGELRNLYSRYVPSLRAWGPRLLPASHASIDLASRQASENMSASLLTTAVPLDSLARHLESLIKLPLHDGSRGLFRFQDGVVMANFVPLLTPGQQGALLGPLLGWWVLDQCGGVVSVQRKERTVSRGTLTLTRRQLEMLDERLLPATVIAQINEVETTLLAGLDGCAKWCDVRARLERARSHGLTVPPDLSLFVILSLQMPADFDRVGPVARALRRAQETGIGFARALEQVPVQEWREWDELLDGH